MPTKQFSYTLPARSNQAVPNGLPETFILKIDEDRFDQLFVQNSQTETHLERDECQIQRFRPDGTLSFVEPNEMEAAFGTRNWTNAAKFIAQRGQYEGTFPKLDELEGKFTSNSYL